MRLHAALLAVLALGACGKGTAVVVNVTSAGPLPVDHFAVDASIGTAMRTFTVPLGDKTFPPEHSFVIDVGNDRSGTIDVTVDAQSAGGDSLGKASGSVMLVHGKQVSIDLTLGGAPDGGVGTDSGLVDDAALACGTTTTACSGTSLVTTCGTSGTTSSVPCPLGCAATATPPRCTQVVPTAPVLTSDVYGSDATSDLTLPTGTVVFDTSTGAITAGATTLRGPNTGTVAARAVQSGIAFGIVPDQSLPDSNELSQAIWSFHSLAIPAGTNVFFAGNNAIGLTSADTVNVAGTLAVMAYRASDGTLCARQYASPGGGGGDQAAPADSFFGTGGNGVEFSGASVYWGGGGGGGFGAPGGTGAYTSTVNNGSTPGTTYGTAALSPIIGGSAGGWADDEEETDSGAGGGAIQIVAATSVTVSGTINAGGCGGTGSNTGGSGGGSGGAILIETPQLSASANAVLAVNGGGGGASGCLTNGSNALASGSPAPGGLCDASHGSAGGAGGAATMAAGSSASQVGPINTTYYGGGGGGGVGRIRYNVATQPTLSTATISPPPASAYTTQGSLATQ